MHPFHKAIKKLIRFGFFISMSVLFFVSCMASVGEYIPDPKMAQGVSGAWNAPTAVKLINVQSDSTQRVLKFKNIIVNYREFTQALIDAINMELIRNGVSTNGDNAKELRLAITEISMEEVSSNYRAKLTAKVETGGGDAHIYMTSRASYASPFNKNTFPTKPLDSAFRDMVQKILRSEMVTSYFSE